MAGCGWGWGGWTWLLGKLPMGLSIYWSPPVSGALTLSSVWRLKFINEFWADCGSRSGGREGLYANFARFFTPWWEGGATQVAPSSIQE